MLSNQPGSQPAQSGGSPSSSQKQTENINYEVSRFVSKIIQPRGDVRSISVAVLVDGSYKKDKDKKVYAPRTEDDLKKYKEIVMAAIGYNKERGDQVIIENVPFEAPLEELPPEKIDFLKLAISLLKYLVPLVVAVLLILFVIKPIIETMKMPVTRKMTPQEAMAAAALQAAPPVEATPDEIIKEDVMEFVKKDPRHASMILKEWMSE